MQIIVTSTPQERAAAELREQLRVHADADILLLVSGGSWLSILALIDASAIGPHCTIGLVDERFSTDVSVNNFAQLQATTFYQVSNAAGCAFLETLVHQAESFTSYTNRFASQLQAWHTTHPDGVVLVALGMGSDGHTAGIFPSFFVQPVIHEEWVRGYQLLATENQFTNRVTVTPNYLQQRTTATVVMVSGVEKCETLAKVQEATMFVPELPATLWNTIPNLVVVSDCSLFS